MGTDIDEIIRRLQEEHPSIRIMQLEVLHVADDDGLWFLSAGGVELNLESSSGNCPFLLESSAHCNSRYVHSIDEAVFAVEEELNLQHQCRTAFQQNQGTK